MVQSFSTPGSPGPDSRTWEVADSRRQRYPKSCVAKTGQYIHPLLRNPDIYQEVSYWRKSRDWVRGRWSSPVMRVSDLDTTSGMNTIMDQLDEQESRVPAKPSPL